MHQELSIDDENFDFDLTGLDIDEHESESAEPDVVRHLDDSIVCNFSCFSLVPD